MDRIYVLKGIVVKINT